MASTVVAADELEALSLIFTEDAEGDEVVNACG